MIITNTWIRTLVHDNNLEVYVIMKFFIDTANVDDIRKANDMGVICGVTTNPSLIAKEGRDFNEVIKEITTIVDGPISGEVKATTVDAEGMIKEGRGQYADPCSMLRATVMLLSHIGYQKQADALEAALDKCMFEEKKLVITGRADGCTCSEFGDYVMDTITRMTK